MWTLAARLGRRPSRQEPTIGDQRSVRVYTESPLSRNDSGGGRAVLRCPQHASRWVVRCSVLPGLLAGDLSGGRTFGFAFSGLPGLCFARAFASALAAAPLGGLGSLPLRAISQERRVS